MAVASREPAREDRWRREEPGNLGTTEFSRAKLPAATDRGDIHTHVAPWGLGSMARRRPATRGKRAPSKSASLAREVSDMRGTDRCVRLVRNLNIATASRRGDRVTPCVNGSAGDAGCPVRVKSSILSPERRGTP